ncbi:hypothetical protein HIM_10451 [Hirsutella minnesotensis 3608]|uniref:Uncharacterized protein n=1 Tax=Hirsutella minnesotensis 3608 TaxID=1043627 RepID=A0A0F8A2A3_9HYPO|nr:hypothetical protein HIM_10451 [Hirsutella minnesotensis 3608]
MGEIVEALRAVRKAVKDAGGNGDGDDEAYRSDPALRRAIRNFYLSLPYQKVSSVPFRSPLLSFCAMLSRVTPVGGSGGKGRGRKADVRGLVWAEPRNFTSHLSAIVWIMQLLVFDFACFYKQDDEDGVLDLIRLMARKAFCDGEETPLGHALAWRNYLGKVAKSAVTPNQAPTRVGVPAGARAPV